MRPSLSLPFIIRLLELMHEYVIRAFDNGNFVLPVNVNEDSVLLWKIRMTNNAAVNTDMGSS